MHPPVPPRHPLCTPLGSPRPPAALYQVSSFPPLAPDLLYCHRPDPDTPIEETVRAMNWVLDQGLAFYWGTSGGCMCAYGVCVCGGGGWGGGGMLGLWVLGVGAEECHCRLWW
jgi:hypothetical protein